LQGNVTDEAASEFAREFYTRLVAGLPAGEACRQARMSLRAREPGNPWWLAYALFGHPGTVFRVEAPLRLGIVSFAEAGTAGAPSIVAGVLRENDRILSLSASFEGRYIRAPALWGMEVVPKLRRFLADGVAAGRSMILDMATHASIAFAAGYFLDLKLGVRVTVAQRGISGTSEWRVDDGEVPAGEPWLEAPPLVLGRGEHLL
jgi:hypothetical protein